MSGGNRVGTRLHWPSVAAGYVCVALVCGFACAPSGPEHAEESERGLDRGIATALPETVVSDGHVAGQHTLTITARGEGTVAPGVGSHAYAAGLSVPLAATPAEGWNFERWECAGDLSLDGATPRSVSVVVDHDGKTVTAVFRNPHDFDVAALGGGTVRVHPGPGGNDSSVSAGPETLHYTADVAVTLTPVPNPGHEMGYWVKESKYNTVEIDYDTGPLTVFSAYCRLVTAVFKPQEGEPDAAIDVVLSVVGPGQVLIEYENAPSRVTSHSIVDSVPAGETVRATALAPNHPEGVFLCWEIASGGETLYETDATIAIASDTAATAVYLEYAAPGTAHITSVTTRVRGKGSINIGEGTFWFSTYNAQGIPLSGFTTVHLFATPEPGWVFRQWWNAPGDSASPHASVILVGDHNVTAEFVARPGMGAFDFVADLGEFLVDIDHIDDPRDVQKLDFDTGGNPLGSRDAKGVLQPSGIPDAAELALLQGILQDPSIELARAGGVSHTLLWDYYHKNLTRAEQDLRQLPPYTHRLTAAYMTLGTFGHRETMPHYLQAVFGVSVNPYNFELFGARYFRERGDADNDGVWNIEEWQNAVKANGDVVDMEAVARFVKAAMDRNSDGLDKGAG